MSNALAPLSLATLHSALARSNYPQLDGSQGRHPELNQTCQIEANNDHQAIACWLSEYKHRPSTYRHYQKETERLLLWSITEKHKPLSSLNRQDLEQYRVFLANPVLLERWCDPKGARRGSSKWRLFLGPLSPNAQAIAFSTLQSLFRYLYDAKYLAFNPLSLSRNKSMKKRQEAQRLKTLERILEDDEWAKILAALKNLPESSTAEIFYKQRLKMIIYLLYFLGLRIHELVHSNWSAFRKVRGQWWFFVVGKGNKLGKIPVNDELFLAVVEYRIFLKKPLEPNGEEHDAIIKRQDSKERLGDRRINLMLKELAITASKQFIDKPDKVKKLQRFSAHWIRHLSASMQDRVGIKGKHIQMNHRHEKMETTQQYIHALDEARHKDMRKLKLYSEWKDLTNQSV